MGLLTEGSPLTWEETKALSKHVQDHGIEQFINQFQRLRDRQGDSLKWGDEVCRSEIGDIPTVICIDILFWQ